MLVSFDGRIHPSRWTERPDGDRSGWSRLYERVRDELAGDAWLVGRVTMAEMGKAGPRPCVGAAEVERPHHFARRGTSTYAVALDRSGKLHFDKAEIGGDHVVVLLGQDVPETQLAAVSVSYVVAEDAAMEVSALLDVLGRELGIRCLLLGGGRSYERIAPGRWPGGPDRLAGSP